MKNRDYSKEFPLLKQNQDYFKNPISDYLVNEHISPERSKS